MLPSRPDGRFSLLHLASLAGAATIAAAALSPVTEWLSKPLPSDSLPLGVAAESARDPSLQEEPARRPLADGRRPAGLLDVPVVTEPAGRATAGAGERMTEVQLLSRSALKLRLFGTLRSRSDPLSSLALVLDEVTRTPRTLRVGDELLGERVVEVERGRVIMEHAGRRAFIDEQGAAGSGGPTKAAPALASGEGGAGGRESARGLGAGIRQVSESDYELPRTELERIFSNLNEVALQARIVPAFRDGTAIGFRVVGPRQDSVYARLGVRSGDVVRRVNGYTIDSPERALELFVSLRGTSNVDLELERDGAPVRKRYAVR